ncbi:hypothetical protein CR513_28032, partial [Mucuna pruriens]
MKSYMSGRPIVFTSHIEGVFHVKNLGVSCKILLVVAVIFENKDKQGKSKEKEHDDDDRVTIATSDDLVIIRDFESVNFVSDESAWIIDSGTTLHVTPRKEFFTSCTLGDFGMLKMSNDGVIKVNSVGDVCLQTNMKLWVYVLKINNQVLEKFKQFQALVKRQLGKKTFLHVPKDERSKLDMKTRQCIFIGYDYDEYGYRLYDSVEKKLVRSHHV